MQATELKWLRQWLPWRRHRQSVRGKLTAVVLLTTLIALGVAGTAMLRHDLGVYREAEAADFSAQAGILALSTASALAFDDLETAKRNVMALRVRPTVQAVAVYSANGALFASYVRPGAMPPPSLLADGWQRVRVSAQGIEVRQPVIQAGEQLGTIYLRANYDIAARVRAYLSIFGLVMLMSAGVAFALSTVLRRVITGPLDDMAEVSRAIIERRDYALRAHKTTNDEIGLVVDAFNRMLDEVQVRSRAMEQSNHTLKAEVRVRLAAEEALARANTRLESSMAAAEIGSWVKDIRSGEVTADRNFAALYLLDGEHEYHGAAERLRQCVHPSDLPQAILAEQLALQTGVLPSTEYRVVRPDGSVRWLASRGKVHYDEGGAPLRMTGVVIDITAQRLAEQALRESEKLYRAVGESIDFGVWLCDATGRNQYASDSFLKLTGLSQQQCSGLGWGEVLHPDETADTLRAWQEVVRSGGNWYREQRIRGTDGHYHAILTRGVPIRGDDGRITGWAGINLDISRLKHTEQALREADRRKDEFLATLAHELRNPLAPIRHAVRLLELPGIDESKRGWGREVITRQVQRMALLLDDLLDVSRITRGKLELRRTQVDLAALVDAALETARPLIDAKHHRLELDMPREPVQLHADSLRLSQALANLLTNAAKYTDTGGHILLRVCLESDCIRMTVRDNGIGLKPESIPSLFEMFSQVESAIDRSEGGLGIGLALVRGLAALHGGTVQATSEGIGRGSEFTIRLPLSLRANGTPAANSEVMVAGVRPAGMRNSCRVLVADDNADAAESLALLLKLFGHEVHVAHSGLGAIETGMREHPDVAILDIGMPDCSGYEVAQRIRQLPWGKSALLLAVTGWGQEHDKKSARAAGFDHHMTKPVDPDMVAQLLNAFLQDRSSAHLRRDSGSGK